MLGAPADDDRPQSGACRIVRGIRGWADRHGWWRADDANLGVAVQGAALGGGFERHRGFYDHEAGGWRGSLALRDGEHRTREVAGDGFGALRVSRRAATQEHRSGRRAAAPREDRAWHRAVS